MTLSLQHLPDNLSGMKTPDSSHLLTSVSPTALERAGGWEKGAELINATLGRLEAVMNIGPTTNDNRDPSTIAE